MVGAMKRTVSILFATLGLVALAAPACGGDSSGGATPSTGRVCTTVEPTLASLNKEIFSTTETCGGTNCHGKVLSAGNTLKLEGLDDATVLSALLMMTDRLDGSVRVVPGDPAKSFLLAKVKGDFTGFPCEAVKDKKLAGHCADRMPGPPNASLCANEIAAIEKWIADGAKP